MVRKAFKNTGFSTQNREPERGTFYRATKPAKGYFIMSVWTAVQRVCLPSSTRLGDWFCRIVWPSGSERTQNHGTVVQGGIQHVIRVNYNYYVNYEFDIKLLIDH